MALRLLPLPLVFAACVAHAQVGDPNLQNLLAALTTGSVTTLVTPLSNGMVQLTSFQPGTSMTPLQANQVIKQARDSLQAMGEPQPSAEEIARMLAGGPIDLPAGRIQTAGLLPSAGWPASIRSQVVLAGTALPSAAAGGTAPASAREQAIQQLNALGIVNPSEQQIRAALVGGTITTVNGVQELPGILTR